MCRYALLSDKKSKAKKKTKTTKIPSFFFPQKKSFQTPGESFHSIVRFLSWLCGVLFLPLENIAVLTQHGVLNRSVDAARKAELGPRCVYFWFYSLAFEHVHHALSLAKLQSSSAEERAAKTTAIVKKWLQCTLWFVMAWASMPATGTVQLLSNPTQSLLRPLHLFVEMTTVNGISVGPFTQAACGLAATALQIDGVLEEERNSEAAKQK